VVVGIGVACAVAGVLMRWWPRSALWLDEAQSVSFAKLPLMSIPGALRQDGAPPAYYLALHAWMAVFGDASTAVRALSALLSTVTLVVVGVWVRRRWSSTAAALAVGTLAVSPFAIRYGAEARMYSLVMFEVAVGLVVVDRAWRRPTFGRLVPVVAVSTLLLYTHYWGLYLVAATAMSLYVVARRGHPTARNVARAVAAGFVLWLPWAPTFWYQSRHTGTPWAAPASVSAGLQVFTPNLGGPTLVIVLFGIWMVLAFAAGALAPPSASGSPIGARAVAGVAAGTVALGVLGAMVSGSAVSTRYFAVAVPLVVLVAAVGLLRVPMPWRAAAFLVVAAAGLVLGASDITAARTTATAVAKEIRARAVPGDVVIYCPDQLAPAVHRLLGSEATVLDEITFPPGSQPARVNWIDYGDRAARAQPLATVEAVSATHPSSSIWVVISTGYPPTQSACRGLLDAVITSGRPVVRLRADDPTLVEHGALWWFGPPGS
jgi:mannosyltransferase